LALRNLQRRPLADDSVTSPAAAGTDEKRFPSTPPYRTPKVVAPPLGPTTATCGRGCRSGAVRGGGEENVAPVVDPNTHGGSCEGEGGNGRRESAPRRTAAPRLDRSPRPAAP
jgi:hypothetical protein